MKKTIARTLNLPKLLDSKSFFLFGPRATGKTTLIREQLPNAIVINLLRGKEFLRLSSSPWELETMIEGAQRGANNEIIVIDEVQRVPELLNEVHRLMEERNMKFLLTGSSARTLRSKGVNLLAGRAWRADLFPLVCNEIPKFQLDSFLRYGGLPSVVTSNNPEEELHAYVETYLTEEIKAEGAVRQLPAFSRFLKVATINSGLRINFANVASDSQVPPSTVTEYYTLLEDTLIGFRLEPWTKSVKRKATQTARFYIFDVGVFHTLNETRELSRNSDLYGRSFEHFIAQELRAYLSYSRSREKLSFWRSQSGAEVDFCVGETVAIECKASGRATLRDAKGLQALREEGVFEKFLVVSNDEIPRIENQITFMPWQHFVKELWEGTLVK